MVTDRCYYCGERLPYPVARARHPFPERAAETRPLS